jgi:pimeloyl-ACP methyl ester carboxylesterase
MSLHTQTVPGGPGRMVFLHGLMGRGKNFTRIAKDLSDDYTSLLVDLPDHGQSPWSKTFDYFRMADTAAAAIRSWLAVDPQGPGTVVLVGHSMGGKVAMELALRHQDLISHLIVVDISPVRASGSEDFDKLLGALEAIDLDRLESRAQADEQLRGPVPQLATRGFLLQNLRPSRDDTGAVRFAWQPNLALLHASLDRLADFPDPHTGPYPGPVLWIKGERSSYVLPAYTAEMRRYFPRCTKITIKGAGHWVHAEKPAEFVSAVRAFLDRSTDR